MYFTYIFSFFVMIHIYYVSSSVVFALFLAQNCKTKVLTAHKNLLLECLRPCHRKPKPILLTLSLTSCPSHTLKICRGCLDSPAQFVCFPIVMGLLQDSHSKPIPKKIVLGSIVVLGSVLPFCAYLCLGFM